MEYTLHNGNSAEILKQYPANHFDSIVTDPPYGINFLGKSWDSNVGEEEVYRECFRVLKPGGHILAFSAARTYHHLAMTIERVGFEIRDQIMWIYGSGFPKSQDVGRSIQRTNKNEEPNEWSGWGTQLKPAHEPICMARKPMKGSIKDNVLKHGVGALNIDACRVGDEILEYVSNTEKGMYNGAGYAYGDNADKAYNEIPTTVQGRFPANVIGEIEEPYQKYFYCPKVSRKERHIGHEMPPAMFGDMKGCYDENGERYAVGLDARTGNVGNNHPTVKPIELMKYLIKLVTPKNGRVLDPFNGSGSTGCAAVSLGHHYTGIDLDEKYIEISKKRIEEYNKEPNTFSQLFTDK
jgi:site-specific DNA-methyltransferase (adenine-specific)